MLNPDDQGLGLQLLYDVSLNPRPVINAMINNVAIYIGYYMVARYYIWILSLSDESNIFTHCFHHEKIKFMSSSHRVFLFSMQKAVNDVIDI